MAHHPDALLAACPMPADACVRAAVAAPLITVLKIDATTPAATTQGQYEFVKRTIRDGELVVPPEHVRSPRTVDAEKMLAENASNYLSVGRCYPVVAGAVLLLLPDAVPPILDWRVTPFDSGGVLIGRIVIDPSYGTARDYVVLHSLSSQQPAPAPVATSSVSTADAALAGAPEWRAYFARYLDYCFAGSVAEYWHRPEPTRVPCIIDWPDSGLPFSCSMELRVGETLSVGDANIAVSRTYHARLLEDAALGDDLLLARLNDPRVEMQDDPCAWAESFARREMT